MNRLISTYLAVSAIALIAPRPAGAAALDINDTGLDPNIVFSMNDFEGGFSIDGVQRQIGLNSPASFTVSEGTAASGPITHSFSGDWIVPSGLELTSGTIAFAENGIPAAQGVSDILTFAYTAGPLGGHLTGTFESDLDPGLLPLPAGATVLSEATPFVFDNAFITADARSDVEVVPAPLIGFGLPVFLAVGGLLFGAKLLQRNRGDAVA
jgi:hypothetical protein